MSQRGVSGGDDHGRALSGWNRGAEQPAKQIWFQMIFPTIHGKLDMDVWVHLEMKYSYNPWQARYGRSLVLNKDCIRMENAHLRQCSYFVFFLSKHFFLILLFLFLPLVMIISLVIFARAANKKLNILAGSYTLSGISMPFWFWMRISECIN